MYLPLAFLILSVLMGGDIIGNIIGIAGGHCFYFIKDVVPIKFRKDILITPKFVSRKLDHIGQPERPRATFGQTGQSTNSQSENSRGTFSAFSGRGSSWG